MALALSHPAPLISRLRHPLHDDPRGDRRSRSRVDRADRPRDGPSSMAQRARGGGPDRDPDPSPGSRYSMVGAEPEPVPSSSRHGASAGRRSIRSAVGSSARTLGCGSRAEFGFRCQRPVRGLTRSPCGRDPDHPGRPVGSTRFAALRRSPRLVGRRCPRPASPRSDRRALDPERPLNENALQRVAVWIGRSQFRTSTSGSVLDSRISRGMTTVQVSALEPTVTRGTGRASDPATRAPSTATTMVTFS